MNSKCKWAGACLFTCRGRAARSHLDAWSGWLRLDAVAVRYLRPVLGGGVLRYNPGLSPPAALDGRPRIYFRSKRLDPWH